MNYNIIKQLTKKSIPILENIKVKNGIASATNLDITITWKTDLENGIYTIEDLKNGLRIPNSEIDPEDFPVIPEVNTNNFTILNNDIFYAPNYCSKDDLKASLQYIHIKNYVEATNGHVLFRKKINPEPEKFIHKDIIFYAKRLKMNTLKYSENKEYYSVFNDDYTITAKKMDGKYPEVDKIIRKKSEHKTNLRQWNNIYKTYKGIVNKGNHLIIFENTIVRTGGEKTIYSQTENNILQIGFDIEYMNLLQKTMQNLNLDLEMEYGSRINAVLFRNSVYTFLIMPLRVLKDENGNTFDKENATEITLKKAIIRKPKKKKTALKRIKYGKTETITVELKPETKILKSSKGEIFVKIN